MQLRAHLGAATLHGALTAAGAAYALPFEAADAEHLSALVDDLRQQLGASSFASAVRRGATLSDGEIIEFVREQIHTLSGPNGSKPEARPRDPDATQQELLLVQRRGAVEQATASDL